MSWFTDIAGKAEDFLNKIDQNAAVALTVLEEHTGNRRSSKTWPSESGAVADDIKSDYAEDLASLSRASSNASVESKSFPVVSVVGNQTNQTKPDNVASIESDNRQPTKGSTIKSLGTRSRPKSKPVKEESNNDTKSQTNINGNGSVNGVNGNSATKTTTDDQLLEYLNTPTKKEMDESSLLKNELAAQGREMGMILKNNKKLQQDYEAQSKALESLRKELNARESQLSSKEEGSRQEIDTVRAQLLEKDKEISQIRDRLDETLEKLKATDSLLQVQNRVEQLELENRKLSSFNSELEEKLLGLNDQLNGSEKQAQSAKEALLIAQNEYAQYKEKAKSILRSKDEIISSIKNSTGSSHDVEVSSANDSQIMAEIQSLRNERELLHGEISQSRVLCESLKEENHRLATEVHQIRSTFLELQDTNSRERAINHSIEEENLQLSQKVSSLKLELEREKSERRKLDLKKNSSEADLTSNNLESSSSRISPAPDNPDENLRTRIKALSHALMEKQSMINNLSADKQMLQIRVERLQSQMEDMAEESNSHVGLTQTVVSSQPLYLSESPWDSNVTTKVKRVYSRVDSLCCQFGLAMRHRPNLRLGFSLYILMLHLWVFFILFYWSHSNMPHPYNRR